MKVFVKFINRTSFVGVRFQESLQGLGSKCRMAELGLNDNSVEVGSNVIFRELGLKDPSAEVGLEVCIPLIAHASEAAAI